MNAVEAVVSSTLSAGLVMDQKMIAGCPAVSLKNVRHWMSGLLIPLLLLLLALTSWGRGECKPSLQHTDID